MISLLYIRNESTFIRYFKVKGIDSAIDSIEFEKDRLRKEMDSEGSEDSSQKD